MLSLKEAHNLNEKFFNDFLMIFFHELIIGFIF